MSPRRQNVRSFFESLQIGSAAVPGSNPASGGAFVYTEGANGVVKVRQANGSIIPIETRGGLNSLAAQVSVSALSTVTTITSYVIPANTLAVGTTYQITASGTVDNSAASPTFNWSVRLGGTTVASVQIASVTAASTAKAWRSDALITLRSIGTAGTVIGSVATLNEVAGTILGAVNIDSPTVAVAANTTLALTLDLVMFMGAAVAGNIMRAEMATVELVRP